jgi:amidase
LNLDYATATDLLSALRARRVSAVELVDRAIDRIEARDGEINAVVVRDFERARAAAQAADAALARGERRTLLGLPITVKEAHAVAGLPTTWGLPGAEASRAERDGVAVARLRAAGAILLGKTNVPTMLADFQSYNPIHGVTRNPWDPARTPGGSSGGSAAALAAGYVSLELGSDLGGSLRVPAHCCGVFAHKPTHGLVPMRGFAPPGTPFLSVGPTVDLSVLGPMARSAADLALALDVLAGPDDAEALAYALALPPPRHARLEAFRVLVVDSHPLLPVGDSVRSALSAFSDGLAAAGCSVGHRSPALPDLAVVVRTFAQLLMSFMGAGLPDDQYQGLQSAAAALPAEDASPQAMRLRGMVLSHRDWIRADRVRAAVAHQWRDLFREWDVVLCPVLPIPAFPHDHAEMVRRRIQVDGKAIPHADLGAWSALATLPGLPATAMPIGTSEEGLPIGVQIVGPFLEDRTTLAFADLAERAFGGFRAPPGFA